jgi:Protein of unknown function (DUF1064)
MVTNKYGAIPTVFQGHRYDSKREAAYAQELELRRIAGDIRAWEAGHRISLDVGGQHVCDYIADFKVWRADNTVEFVDVKGGKLLPVFKLKMKLLIALHPEIKVRIVR